MSLQIYILGVLCEGYHHPYDVKKMLKHNNADDLYKVSDGTLYYNFEALLKKGCIQKIEVSREENRPEKTTYGITPKGREVLEQDIYASFKNFKGMRAIYASTLFQKHADKQKLIYLIEDLIDNLQAKNDYYNKVWTTLQHGTPEEFHLVKEYTHNQMIIDLEWLQKLLDFVRRRPE